MIRRIFTFVLILMMILSSSLLTAQAVGERSLVAAKPSPSKLGYAGYADKLDKTVFKGDLGALYSASATTFRLWSPVATDVQVCIYTTGSDDEEGAKQVSATKMKYSEDTGVWSASLNGDYKNRYYTYKVTADGKTNEVVDPYARAVGVNGNRGMIIDLNDTDPAGWDNDSFQRVEYATDAVVWEVFVRDFSADPSSGVSEANRGKYLAFTELRTTLNDEGDIPTCVAYLKELGVNYVQINPFYDFASIDEADTQSAQYNWGYDPKNYNVPEGSYSSDPYDGRVRIKECKQMIQALHQAGIGVIMDVVYNHTYYSEESFFHQIVPYYYHRFYEDGSWSNGSGCGNDVASERCMVRRYIIDSVTYWAEEYHIDGFRFDLMGLTDVETMNRVRKSLDALPDGKQIIMYGEAWKMNTAAKDGTVLANQDNVSQLSKRIGAFSDTARDGIRGFVMEGSPKSGVRASVSGDGGGWTDTPNQCVNYTSCHDNKTLYDALVDGVYRDKNYTLRREDLLAMNRLSAAVVLMSRGMPFFLAGEEFGRTKLGDNNSYKSPIEKNRIDWTLLEKNTSLTDYYRGLIRLRTALDLMNDPTCKRTELTYLETPNKGEVAFMLSGKDHPTVVAAFNGSLTEEMTLTLPEGEWVLLADADRAGTVALTTVKDTITLPPTSAAVLADAAGYASLTPEGDEAVVYLRYVDTVTGSVIREQKVSGQMGAAYRLNVPEDIVFNYLVSAETDVFNGTFRQPCENLIVKCDPKNDSVSTVTFRYLDASGAQIADTVVITNECGELYISPAFERILGYRLDLDRLPENGAGVISQEPIEVIYRYIAEDESADEDGSRICRANVIYMTHEGKVLDVKTLTGAEGESVDVDELSFDGYEILSISDEDAKFGKSEVNIIVNYGEKQSHPYIWFIIGAAALMLAGGLILFFRVHNKRRMKGAMDIDE